MKNILLAIVLVLCGVGCVSYTTPTRQVTVGVWPFVPTQDQDTVCDGTATTVVDYPSGGIYDYNTGGGGCWVGGVYFMGGRGGYHGGQRGGGGSYYNQYTANHQQGGRGGHQGGGNYGGGGQHR